VDPRRQRRRGKEGACSREPGRWLGSAQAGSGEKEKWAARGRAGRNSTLPGCELGQNRVKMNFLFFFFLFLIFQNQISKNFQIQIEFDQTTHLKIPDATA
jgi:hypothetical protein